MESPVTFGEWLQQNRNEIRPTRNEVAKRIGCSVSTLCKIEYGERRPSVQIAELIVNCLNIPAAERSTFVKVARGELSVDRLLPLTKMLASSSVSSASSTPRTNLPVFPTPFIGRQREVEEPNQLLGDPQCRLLTLVGPGGGILAARLDLEGMNSIIARRTGLYETDDAYLVNTSGLFVTQLRFIQNPAVLQRGIHTEAINRCLEQNSGEVEAPDYRGLPAFVVYRWLAERNLCLIVKMDQTEAYRPIRAFGGTIAAISAIALLAAAGLALALARGLTRPILALQSGAARFGRGELDVRLDEVTQDELGQLAAEFNKMAEALAEQQTHLRRRAEQFFRTSASVGMD